MAESLTFENFTIGTDSIYEIGAIAEINDEPARDGVVEEIKTAFGYDGDDLGELIGQVAPEKTLQDNIAYTQQRLSDPEVKKELGCEDKTAIEVARNWGDRSGLQAEVFRPLMQPAEDIPKEFAAVVVTDGVVNWMNRTAAVAYKITSDVKVPLALLVSGGRKIDAGEHPDVEADTLSSDYMDKVLAPKLELPNVFDAVELINTDQEEGQSVMAAAAEYLLENENLDLETAKIIISSVAGNWMQKGSQLRSALKNIQEGFDENPEARQLWVASDSFPFGVVGDEPKATHQNPFSAIGNILRGAKLLEEQ